MCGCDTDVTLIVRVHWTGREQSYSPAEPAWSHFGYKKLGLVTGNVSGDPEDFGWVFERVGITTQCL